MPTTFLSSTYSPIQMPSAERRDDSSKHRTARLNFDIPDALLAEVDFKWLMAGQGLRVDPKRFYSDPAYTMDLLQTGLRSESPAVRACAAYLLEKIESASMVRWPLEGGRQRAIPDAELSPGSRPVPSLSNRRTAQAHRQTHQSDRF